MYVERMGPTARLGPDLSGYVRSTVVANKGVNQRPVQAASAAVVGAIRSYRGILQPALVLEDSGASVP